MDSESKKTHAVSLQILRPALGMSALIAIISRAESYVHPYEICSETRCVFFDPESIARESKERTTAMRKLLMAVILYVLFMTVEVVEGLKSNSLAVFTDASRD